MSYRKWRLRPLVAGIVLSLAAMSAWGSTESDIAKLREQRQQLVMELKGLKGKPEELQKAREQMAEARRDLDRMEVRLRGIQAWNSLVAFVSVFNDTINKGPIYSVANYVATLVVDGTLALATMADNDDPLPAKLKMLSSEVATISPALRQLDAAMRMNDQEVADQLVARGMVKNTWVQRWKDTPDVVEKSKSVVTGKITFIQERIGPAKKALYASSMAANEAASAMMARIAGLENQIRALDSTLEFRKLALAQEEAAKKAAQDVPESPPMREVQLSYPAAAMSYDAAAADLRQAWSDFKAGNITDRTFQGLKAKAQAGAYEYYDEKMKPFKDERDKAYAMWRQARGEEWNKAAAAYREAAVRFDKAGEAESAVLSKEFVEIQNSIDSQRTQEYGRMREFDQRFYTYKGQRLPAQEGVIRGEIGWDEGRNYMGYGDGIAFMVWSPALSQSSNRALNASDVEYGGHLSSAWYQEKVDNAQKDYAVAQKTYETTVGLSAVGAGYAEQADRLAEELKPNLNFWEELSFGRQWYRRMHASLNDALASYQAYAEQAENIVKVGVERKRDRHERISRAAAVVRQAEQQLLPQARELVKLKRALLDMYRKQGIRAAGASARVFLDANTITSEEVARIKGIVEVLQSKERAMEYACNIELPYSDRQSSSRAIRPPHHTLESLNEVKKRDAARYVAFKKYQTLWEQADKLERELRQKSEVLQREYSSFVPGPTGFLSVEALIGVIEPLGSRGASESWEAWNWRAPDPQDLSVGWPEAQGMFEPMEAALKAYDAKLAEARPGLASEWATAVAKVDALTAQAQRYQTVEFSGAQVTSLQSGLDSLWQKFQNMGPPNYAACLRYDDSGAVYTAAQQKFRSAYAKAVENLSRMKAHLGGAAIVDGAVLDKQQVHTLYQDFINAYGRGDVRGLLGLLAPSWRGGDGADAQDAEATLVNSFRVFERVQYRISNFKVEPLNKDRARVSYDVKIIGENGRQRLVHEETSQVVEEVGVVGGKMRIMRTISGSQWLR